MESSTAIVSQSPAPLPDSSSPVLTAATLVRGSFSNSTSRSASASVPRTSPVDQTPRMSAKEWRTFRDQVASSHTPAPRQARMAGVTTTIRVFISSTFVDEHGERDELIRRVFNELNAAFRSRWINVVPVDLRWGVSHEETTVIQQTCLNEIDHCRVHASDAPWFIGLRGERYGWVQVSRMVFLRHQYI